MQKPFAIVVEVEAESQAGVAVSAAAVAAAAHGRHMERCHSLPTYAWSVIVYRGILRNLLSLAGQGRLAGRIMSNELSIFGQASHAGYEWREPRCDAPVGAIWRSIAKDVKLVFAVGVGYTLFVLVRAAVE